MILPLHLLRLYALDELSFPPRLNILVIHACSAVHFSGGLWGVVAVGLFNTKYGPLFTLVPTFILEYYDTGTNLYLLLLYASYICRVILHGGMEAAGDSNIYGLF